MRVLIVEDDEGLSQTLKWMSELKGHAAEVRQSGEGAVKAFLEWVPNLVLIGGDQAEIWAHTAFDDDQLREAKAACFDGWLIKGSDMKRLEALL